MKWTTKRPTKEGWYWAIFTKDYCFLKVIMEAKTEFCESTGSYIYAVAEGESYELCDFVAFAGPIPEPEDDEIEVER